MAMRVQTFSFASVNEAGLLEIESFTINPKTTYQNSYVDFFVTIKNIGNIGVDAEPRISILAPDNEIHNITFNYSIIQPNLETIFYKQWFSNDYPTGTYSVTLEVPRDEQSDLVEIDEFSIISRPSETISTEEGSLITPSAISTPIIPPEETTLKFLKLPILEEKILGESFVIGAEISNPTNSEVPDVSIKVSGLPEEWVDITPEKLTLPPEEKEDFSIAIKISDNAEPGDYKVKVILKNSKVHDENFFILRIKPYTLEFEKPVISRSVGFNKNEDTTKIIVSVNNGPEFVRLIKIKEEIPKDIAQSSDDVVFDFLPSRIIERDPVVEWELKDLYPNEVREISYQVKKIPKEYSTYVYWSLKEIQIIPKILEEMVNILEISAKEFELGKSSRVKVVLKNYRDEKTDITLKLDAPPDWRVYPDQKTLSLLPEKTKTEEFGLTVPSSSFTGLHTLSLNVMYGKEQIVEDFVVLVKTPIGSTNLIIYLVFFLGCGLLAVWFLKKYKIRRKSRKRRIK